jgi:hypothetical protein
MSERRTLPQRRGNETFEITHGDQRRRFQVTVTYFEHDHAGPAGPAEVFVTGAKAGSEFEAIARDGAILLSLCLQHGVPLSTIKGAITRNSNGDAGTIIGAVVDRLSKI